MNTITFYPENHTYKTELGLKYISATTVIGRYKEAFDEDFMSTYKAIEKIIVGNSSNQFFQDFKRRAGGYKKVEEVFRAKAKPESIALIVPYKELILKEWHYERDIACFNGSNFHDAKEKGWLEAPEHFEGVVKKSWHTTGIQNMYGVNISPAELPDGVYSELILWNNHFEIAGAADIVYIETIDGIRYIDIDDYKTNKKIEEVSFNHPRFGYSKMLKPLHHLMDCNRQHYELQISLYAFMLESFGFTVRNLNFQHWRNVATKEDGEMDKENPRYELNQNYILEYRKKEIIKMLEHYIKNR